jgi:two-component system response regulator RegX3
MSARILLVDDEADIVEAVSWALRRDGFEVDTRHDGESAIEVALAVPYDLVILDVMLPGVSGIEACKRLRAESDVPIIMLTARDAEVDRVIGLEIGADDYVTKPFSNAELASRVRAILRRRELDRAAVTPTSVITIGGIQMDMLKHEITVDGRPVGLTPSEFRLLSLLANHLDHPLSRAQIMEELWQSSYVGSARACDAHVANLRKKIERDPAHPTRLLTVREIGYKLVAD